MRNRDRLILIVLFLVVSLACSSLTRPPLAFSPLELPEARLGHPYEVTITISGNETPVRLISVDRAELPPGLFFAHLSTDTFARIEGVPEKAGEFEFVVSAECWHLGVLGGGQTGEQRYTLLVREE